MNKGEHGPDKLYNKFTVIKNSTGKELDPEVEFFFVLRPETNDRAAIAALETYAKKAEYTYPELANQILTQLARIRSNYPNGNPAARTNGK